jgi:hypothetical protein
MAINVMSHEQEERKHERNSRVKLNEILQYTFKRRDLIKLNKSETISVIRLLYLLYKKHIRCVCWIERKKVGPVKWSEMHGL